jgi:hypothetical protein
MLEKKRPDFSDQELLLIKALIDATKHHLVFYR